MEYSVILPDDPSVLPVPMKRFVFTTDDVLFALLIEDNLSEDKLRDAINELSEEEVEEVVRVVKAEYSEEEIGETEFSKVTQVAKIERILPGEDQK